MSFRVDGGALLASRWGCEFALAAILGGVRLGWKLFVPSRLEVELHWGMRRSKDLVLNLLTGSLPCLLLAAIPVWRISLQAPLPRRDRLMLVLLMYAAYALVFLCVHLAVKVLRYVIQRSRGPAEMGGLGGTDFSWEYFFMAGLLLSNTLHFLFGYKKQTLVEQTWLMARGPVAQLLLLAAGWLLLLLLFRFARRNWPTLLGSALEKPAVIALILVIALSCVVPPGTNRRAAAADAAFARERVAAPTVGSSTHRPLILVGLDGVDWLLLRAAMRTGRLQTLSELARYGFTSSLDNGGLGLSPVVWTTIATGKPMDEHEIFGFDVTRSPLLETPLDAWLRYSPPEFAVWPSVRMLRGLGLVENRLATGADRKGPSLWQILSHHNHSNLVVNYMGSFPAERINGVFLAGYAYELMLTESGKKGKGGGSMKPDGRVAGKAAEGVDYPVGLLAREYSHIRPAATGPLDATSRHEREFDYFAALTLEILKGHSFDFVTFYTWVTDSFNHGLSVAEYEAILQGRFESPLTRRFLEIYEKIDAFLAELRRVRPDANLIIVSDHGVAPAYELRQRKLLHGRGPAGIFIAHGPDIRPGPGSAAISMYDIAPTVLFYFDVPVARDFKGRIVTELFSVSSTPRYVDSYDPIVPNARVQGPHGEIDGVRERLKALGYLE